MVIGFVGGGTGGHFYPLMAVADVLNETEASPELYYFGPDVYDANALQKRNITFVSCPAGKIRRYFSIQNFFDIFRSFFGIFVAIWKLYVIYPDVIFSKGGYTSVPVLTGARLLRIPVVIHESDAVPGRANKLAMRQARYIGIAYDDVAKFFPPEKTALVGIPLNREVTSAPANARELLGIPNDKPLIYVTGGSQGAERLNNLILSSLNDLLPYYRIYHQTGPVNLKNFSLTAQSQLFNSPLQDSYYLAGSIPPETVGALLRASDLVITRAGSTTLFEIAYFGKPAIVIPIPEDVSRDQRSNAYAYARGGAATVMEEHNLTTHLLIQEIRAIMDNPDRYQKMSESAKSLSVDDAPNKLAGVLISIGVEHGS
jgi:UDP-N-acetylglucosamine--N-acetylmuramyl-(pentapeptide) pyrophosphoryl-undecaprenol N-acetylglucosamine transferase